MSLTAECTEDKAFGLVPDSEPVFWHYTNLPARWNAQSPLKVQLLLPGFNMNAVRFSSVEVVLVPHAAC